MKKKNYENYKNLNKTMNIKMLIAFILGAIISVTSSYAIAETLIKSADVSYVDNSKLGATNVQAAIDGTCTKFSNDLATLLDKMYPVGSIYISTSLSTPAQVGSAIGGTWASYGVGKTLLSSTTSEQTGGSNTVTLTTDNLPSHSHSFTPLGSVTSTFTGTAVNTSTTGKHSHIINNILSWPHVQDGTNHDSYHAEWSPSTITAWSDRTATSTTDGDHYHSVTAEGTVSSTFTGTAGTTGATGKATAVNVQNPYITVYMYKRTK